MQKLEALVVDEKVPLSDSMFYTKLSVPKVEKIRQAKRELKEAVDAAEDIYATHRKEAPPVVPKAKTLITEASQHAVHFGFLAFMKHAHIRVASDTGVKLRSNLKDIWAANSTDSKLKEYSTLASP